MEAPSSIESGVDNVLSTESIAGNECRSAHIPESEKDITTDGDESSIPSISLADIQFYGGGPGSSNSDCPGMISSITLADISSSNRCFDRSYLRSFQQNYQHYIPEACSATGEGLGTKLFARGSSISTDGSSEGDLNASVGLSTIMGESFFMDKTHDTKMSKSNDANRNKQKGGPGLTSVNDSDAMSFDANQGEVFSWNGDDNAKDSNQGSVKGSDAREEGGSSPSNDIQTCEGGENSGVDENPNKITLEKIDQNLCTGILLIEQEQKRLLSLLHDSSSGAKSVSSSDQKSGSSKDGNQSTSAYRRPSKMKWAQSELHPLDEVDDETNVTYEDSRSDRSKEAGEREDDAAKRVSRGLSLLETQRTALLDVNDSTNFDGHDAGNFSFYSSVQSLDQANETSQSRGDTDDVQSTRTEDSDKRVSRGLSLLETQKKVLLDVNDSSTFDGHDGANFSFHNSVQSIEATSKQVPMERNSDTTSTTDLKVADKRVSRGLSLLETQRKTLLDGNYDSESFRGHDAANFSFHNSVQVLETKNQELQAKGDVDVTVKADDREVDKRVSRGLSLLETQRRALLDVNDSSNFDGHEGANFSFHDSVQSHEVKNPRMLIDENANATSTSDGRNLDKRVSRGLSLLETQRKALLDGNNVSESFKGHDAANLAYGFQSVDTANSQLIHKPPNDHEDLARRVSRGLSLLEKSGTLTSSLGDSSFDGNRTENNISWANDLPQSSEQKKISWNFEENGDIDQEPNFENLQRRVSRGLSLLENERRSLLQMLGNESFDGNEGTDLLLSESIQSFVKRISTCAGETDADHNQGKMEDMIISRNVSRGLSLLEEERKSLLVSLRDSVSFDGNAATNLSWTDSHDAKDAQCSKKEDFERMRSRGLSLLERERRRQSLFSLRDEFESK